jgi:beta-N-acetylhexosaminidase
VSVISADGIYSEWSLEEKIGQLLMGAFQGPVINDQARTLLKTAHVGHIILYANNVESRESVKQLCADLQKITLENSPLPLNIAIDQEGGRVTRLKGEGFTSFPSARSVAETKNRPLAKDVAIAMAKEMKAVGITMNLAPVVDVNTNPLNPVIGNRSFGEDTNTVISFGGETIDGFHKEGIATCIKHFPGHGDTSVDSHLNLPVVDKNGSALEATELPPFCSLSPSTDAIMTAHVLIPSWDKKWCATFSPKILGWLREMFDGLIISDSITMQGALEQVNGNIVEAALQAIEAGCDVLCIGGLKVEPQIILDVHQGIVNAVRTGRISIKRIDESLNRVARFKRNIQPISQDTPLLTFPEHRSLVKTVAEKSFQWIKQDVSCSLEGKKLFVFCSLAIKEELAKTTFFERQIVDQLTDSVEDLKNIESKHPEEADMSLWIVHNIFINPKLQAILKDFAEKSGPIALITVGSPYDSTYFQEFENIKVIANTYSPTQDAIQHSLECLK